MINVYMAARVKIVGLKLHLICGIRIAINNHTKKSL